MSFIIALIVGMTLSVPVGWALGSQFGIWGILMCIPVGYLIGAGSAEVFKEI